MQNSNVDSINTYINKSLSQEVQTEFFAKKILSSRGHVFFCHCEAQPRQSSLMYFHLFLFTGSPRELSFPRDDNAASHVSHFPTGPRS